MSVLGWMAQYEDVRLEPSSRLIKAVRLRKLAEAVDPDLDVTTRTLMQLKVEAALEELGTNDSPVYGGPGPDILLQTQQVSLAEVRQDLCAWKDAMAEELSALIAVHQAVRGITKAELQELEGQWNQGADSAWEAGVFYLGPLTTNSAQIKPSVTRSKTAPQCLQKVVMLSWPESARLTCATVAPILAPSEKERSLGLRSSLRSLRR